MRLTVKLLCVFAFCMFSLSHATADECAIPKTKNEAFNIVESLLQTNTGMQDAERLSSQYILRYVMDVRTPAELKYAQKLFDNESGPYKRGAEFALAVAYARMGDESKAKAYLAPSREVAERSAIAIRLAKLYVEQGRHQDARGVANKIMNAGKRRVLIGNISREQVKVNEVDEALQTLKLLKPGENIVIENAITTLADAGYVDEAAELFESNNIQKRSFGGAFAVIRAYSRAGRDEEAEAFAEPIISDYKAKVAKGLSPDFAGRHVVNGQLLRLIDQGELDRAEKEIKRLYEQEEQIDRTKPNAPPKLTPTEARYALRAARIEEALARKDFANALLEGKKRPKLERSLARMVEEAAKAGRLDMAIATLESIPDNIGSRRGAMANMARWVVAGSAPEKYCELLDLVPEHVQIEMILRLAPSLP